MQPKALGEPRLVLERLEVAFGKRVIVGRVRPIVRSSNAEIGEQQCGGFGHHRAAAIGMQGELARWHMVLGDRVVEQRPEQHGAFRIGHTPADHTATEDVEDDVKIEVAPFGCPISLVMSQDQT